MKGKMHHIQSRLQIGQSQSERIRNQGGISEETREKMSVAQKRRHLRARLLGNLRQLDELKE